LKEAMIEEKDEKISARLAVFNKSSENRFRAEIFYREELERRRFNRTDESSGLRQEGIRYHSLTIALPPTECRSPLHSDQPSPRNDYFRG
jgi:hypothetical protein